MKNVFLYYADEDAEFAKQFRQHLNPIGNEGKNSAGLIQIFDCAEILAGEKPDEVLKEKIEAAEIILLCLSAALLDEDRFDEKINPKVWSQYSRGKCLVIPVLMQPFLYSYTIFAKLKISPASGVPINAYANKAEGFTQVVQELAVCVEAFDEVIAEQKKRPEIEKIKYALENFNFYEQFTPTSQTLPTSPFSVLLLKGRSKSGHDLLGWRWREQAMPGLTPDVLTYNLDSDIAKASNIDTGVWSLLHQGMGYTGAPAQLMSQLANQLYQILQERALVIRFDSFKPTLHQTLIEDFLEALSTALQEIKTQKPGDKQRQPFWFYLLYRFEEEEQPFALTFDAQVVLPTVKAVSKEDFTAWNESLILQQCPIMGTYITNDYKKEKIIIPKMTGENEVMDVLDRVCQSVYAKEDLFDKYIATKK